MGFALPGDTRQAAYGRLHRLKSFLLDSLGGLGGALAGAMATGVPGFPLLGVPITARGPFVLSALMIAVMLLAGPVASWLLRRRSAATVAA